MLKGIPGILSPDLLKILMEMGHGDEIVIDVPGRRIDLALSAEEIVSRIAKFRWEFPGSEYKRYLNLFARNVGSMAKGGIWEV